MSLRLVNHLSMGVVPSVVCLNVIMKPLQLGGPGVLGAVKKNVADFRVILLKDLNQLVTGIGLVLGRCQ